MCASNCRKSELLQSKGVHRRPNISLDRTGDGGRIWKRWSMLEAVGGRGGETPRPISSRALAGWATLEGGTLRSRAFVLFRRFAKLLSGHGLRDRFALVDRLYKRLNRRLAPSAVKVHGHTMYLDRDDSMGLAVQGVYEPAETQLVNDLVKPDRSSSILGPTSDTTR